MKIIFFDIDRTLINHRYAQDTAALLFLRQFASSLPYSPKDFYQLWQAVMEKHFTAFLQGKITFVEHRRRRMKDLFQKTESCLTDDEADGRFAIYVKNYEANWVLFDDVLSCLDGLSNYRLGIISNGNTKQQIRKLCKTEIVQRFDTIVISEEVGMSKPNPEIFLAACCQAKVEIGECLYVGDNLQGDAIAAQAAGLKGVWLNREEVTYAQVSIPVIQSLNELVTAS